VIQAGDSCSRAKQKVSRRKLDLLVQLSPRLPPRLQTQDLRSYCNTRTMRVLFRHIGHCTLSALLLLYGFTVGDLPVLREERAVAPHENLLVELRFQLQLGHAILR